MLRFQQNHPTIKGVQKLSPTVGWRGADPIRTGIPRVANRSALPIELPPHKKWGAPPVDAGEAPQRPYELSRSGGGSSQGASSTASAAKLPEMKLRRLVVVFPITTASIAH